MKKKKNQTDFTRFYEAEAERKREKNSAEKELRSVM